MRSNRLACISAGLGPHDIITWLGGTVCEYPYLLPKRVTHLDTEIASRGKSHIEQQAEATNKDIDKGTRYKFLAKMHFFRLFLPFSQKLNNRVYGLKSAAV